MARAGKPGRLMLMKHGDWIASEGRSKTAAKERARRGNALIEYHKRDELLLAVVFYVVTGEGAETGRKHYIYSVYVKAIDGEPMAGVDGELTEDGKLARYDPSDVAPHSAPVHSFPGLRDS